MNLVSKPRDELCEWAAGTSLFLAAMAAIEKRACYQQESGVCIQLERPKRLF